MRALSTNHTDMKTFRNLAMATALLVAANASAASLTWNTRDGSWDLSSPNWNSSPAVAWSQSDAATDDAIFAGTDGSSVIHVDDDLTAGTLAFNSSGYTLEASASTRTISLTTAGSAASPNVLIAGNKTATLAAGDGNQLIVESRAGNVYLSGGGILNIERGGYVRSASTAAGGVVLESITVNIAAGGNLRALSETQGHIVIGYLADSEAVVNVNGGTMLSSFNGPRAMVVGNLGSGALNISPTEGSQVLMAGANSSLLLASGPASSGTVNLDGGLLAVFSIRTGSGTATFHFNGGTLKAAGTPTEDILNFTCVVKPGGAVIDTQGATVTISGDMTDGGGGLTKLGSGTLILSGANTYSGSTVVQDGTLSLHSPCLSDAGAVRLASDATLELNFLGTDTIKELFINEQKQRDGTWGSRTSTAANKSPHITGTGILQVGARR